jgi:hypothetical protein
MNDKPKPGAGWREWWIHSTGNAYTRDVSSNFPVVHVIEHAAVEHERKLKLEWIELHAAERAAREKAEAELSDHYVQLSSELDRRIAAEARVKELLAYKVAALAEFERMKRQLAVMQAGLEHYESAHYCVCGNPCAGDSTARETLAEADKIESNNNEHKEIK